MVPAVAGGILRRPQASASALGLCDSVNCLDLCLGRKSALVEHVVLVYMKYFVTKKTFRYDIFSFKSKQKNKKKGPEKKISGEKNKN